eukprot:1303657-Pleurochrysis_carterae.AAC.2
MALTKGLERTVADQPFDTGRHVIKFVTISAAKYVEAQEAVQNLEEQCAAHIPRFPSVRAVGSNLLSQRGEFSKRVCQRQAQGSLSVPLASRGRGEKRSPFKVDSFTWCKESKF